MDNSEIKQVFRVRNKDFASKEEAQKYIIDTVNEGKILEFIKSEPHDLIDAGMIDPDELCQDITTNLEEWRTLIHEIAMSNLKEEG